MSFIIGKDAFPAENHSFGRGCRIHSSFNACQLFYSQKESDRQLNELCHQHKSLRGPKPHSVHKGQQ